MIFRMKLRSTPNSIRRVEPFLKRINKSAHMDEIQFHKVMVSLTEAVNNAIMHGNRAEPSKQVTVVCELSPHGLELVVGDEGAGFDPSQVDSPLKEENLLRETGRGIFLMRTLMDRVTFDVAKKGVKVRLWLDLEK